MTVMIKEDVSGDGDNKEDFRVMVTIKRMFQGDGDNKEDVSG